MFCGFDCWVGGGGGLTSKQNTLWGIWEDFCNKERLRATKNWEGGESEGSFWDAKNHIERVRGGGLKTIKAQTNSWALKAE